MPHASAAEAPLKDYELTWGIKQSYRACVTGMAAGTFTPAVGAAGDPLTVAAGAGVVVAVRRRRTAWNG
ncbi:Htaa domain protein [Actinobacteria bacterium OK006]|nr:Htaa domain protein [Actinobacteria bacterium OK006]